PYRTLDFLCRAEASGPHQCCLQTHRCLMNPKQRLAARGRLRFHPHHTQNDGRALFLDQRRCGCFAGTLVPPSASNRTDSKMTMFGYSPDFHLLSLRFSGLLILTVLVHETRSILFLPRATELRRRGVSNRRE